jgi:hypothetical protein
MFDTDLANNPATALSAGTAANLTFSLLSTPSNGDGSSVRSVASVALTAPHTCTIAHGFRRVKGLRFSASNIAAPDIVIDRHIVNFRKVAATPTLLIADPEFKIAYSGQVTLEVPRLGADTPTTALVMDQLLRALVMLNPGANAGAVKLLNGEY